MTEYERLKKAVLAYITEFYWADMDGDRIEWPSELQDLVGWTEPEEREDDE